MTESETPVLLRREGAVAWIILNRPANLNALDVPAAEALRACCAELAADSGVRAVVLKGAGKAFGVGGDLSALRTDSSATAAALIEPLHQAVRLLAEMNAPVIVSLHGAVAGGSLSLSMACDLALAADTAKFNLAYVNVAANCDVSGSWNLPRLVGLRNAMAIALLGESFDAQEALRLGLVNRVVPAAELDAATDALAKRLADGPTLAIGRMKRLMRQSFDNDLATQLDLERENFRASAATEDFAEALDAFFSKRPARFHGR
ncbi:enoyl-CoA hydratase/isomerase family protein [Noviherbaspirillum saxi]|uniref:Enoyl-CoA hydratase n=1 Tax=Noviherbaspirillum saxi TaxID=2320863 RepID=A0A3A3G1H4_9BURK|nr:enoyl-CoA hydratase-related protein [Noviherbaspirillum saxi]RJF91923.1 enoyl-CoA hydratase [Noviherbaspirillum saxi]